jgi:F0F1-type ATP synthase membrane subunit b/b'
MPTEEENEMLDIVDPYEAADIGEPEPETPAEEVAETPEVSEETETKEEVEATPEEEKTPDFAVTIDGDVYDDELVSQFKAMQRDYDRKIEKLNDQISSMSQQAEEFAANQLFEAIDQPERFGIGSVKADSEAGQNRQRVVEEMASLKAGYESTNREIPAESDLVTKALHSAFGEEMAEKVRQDFTEKITARHNSRIARPNGRVSKPGDRVVEATRNVAALMRDRGLTESLENFD